MTRARNIKPGFFNNEELCELPFQARILYIGLWCIADREGRLEDRPKRIKATVFPYDALSIDSLLAKLEMGGFMVRYESGGRPYIWLPSFKKHQSPHPKEASSVLPPCALEGSCMDDASAKHESGKAVESQASSGNSGTSRVISLASPSGSSDSYISDSLSSDSSLSEPPDSAASAADECASKPSGVREMRDTILGTLGRFGHDSETIAEAELFAKDFEGQWDAFNHALTEVRRTPGMRPFPGNLRKHMPGRAKEPSPEPDFLGPFAHLANRRTS